MNAELTLKLWIVRKDGTTPDAREVENRLRNAADFLIGNGLLTGDSDDVVDWHEIKARVDGKPLLVVDVETRIWRRVGLRVADPTVDIGALRESLEQMESGYIDQLPQVTSGRVWVESIEDLAETARPLSRDELGGRQVVFVVDAVS
jgi:hypothetical protein